MRKWVVLLGSVLFLTMAAAWAHDTWLPHHKADFEELARRRELRTLVLAVTVGFGVFLVAIAVYGLRSSEPVESLEEIREKQDRLHRALFEAVAAVQDRSGEPKERIVPPLLEAYRRAVQAASPPKPLGADRWQIGEDQLRLDYDPTTRQIYLEATRQRAVVAIRVDAGGEVSFERATVQRVVAP